MGLRFVLVVAVAACTACSSPHEGDVPAHASSAATARSSPALAITSSTPGNLTYLYDLMQRADFSTAFAALSGADQLPAWASQGGVATPAEQVIVNGRTLLLAEACKPHDCPDERILILYDENTHAMSGLFARRKPNATNEADSNEPGSDDLLWLGAPDEASRQVLQGKLYPRH